MFSYQGAFGPESSTSLCLVGRQDNYSVWWSASEYSTWTKPAIYVCFVDETVVRACVCVCVCVQRLGSVLQSRSWYRPVHG